MIVGGVLTSVDRAKLVPLLDASWAMGHQLTSVSTWVFVHLENTEHCLNGARMKDRSYDI